ncbi:MAG: cell division protein FtsW [Flavobacteriales bacterium]|jgi:cell division protein FtsW
MYKLLAHIQGDRGLWAVVFLFMLFSFLPVYSASSNLAYAYSGGNTFSYLIKHLFFVFSGLSIIYLIHKVDPVYFRNIGTILLLTSLVLLIAVLWQGDTIGGANASRWIRLPFIQITFQPSEIAKLALILYLSRALVKHKDKLHSFKESFIPIVSPILMVVILILPANFSTAALIGIISMILLFVGGYPFKHLIKLGFIGVGFLGLFLLLVMAFPDAMPNRVETWKARIENYQDGDSESNYQVEKSKIAIASGHFLGQGPGKSIQKNFLPQSSSDFIYAIIVEEGGLVFGFGVVGFYLIFLIRILKIAHQVTDTFGVLVVIGMGFSVVFQALLNMGVAVNIFPVTGQTLPFISSGGTSLWITCLGMGVVLSISKQMQKKKIIVDEQA